MLLMQASTSMGEVLLAVMCDGMGGLKKGELASAEVERAMAGWFRDQLPVLIRDGFDPTGLRDDWKRIVDEQDEAISRYGARNGFQLGTTLAAILFIGNKYYIINIGDSRVYQVEDNNLFQLTHDHTVVQREVDLGHMTLEQAEMDSRRNILLQCIGASDYTEPDFFMGEFRPGMVFLICCDGFRHVLSAGELSAYFGPSRMRDENQMKSVLAGSVEEIKRRNETDNISAILIKTLS